MKFVITLLAGNKGFEDFTGMDTVFMVFVNCDLYEKSKGNEV